MRTSTLTLAFAAAAAFVLPHPVLAEDALTGQVSSQDEGAMEGVLVRAKKDQGNMNITVVSDAQRHFSFPASKLDAGKYTLSIRAIGYELQGPRTIELTAGKTASADLKLTKAKSVSQQMTNGEWIMSVPGSQQQKLSLLN